jgi:AGCS family alanine or glycine:cation symporter
MYWPWTVGVLMAAGVFLTVRTRAVQVRRFREATRTMIAAQQASAGGALSPFQAFMTALAATIGTGNIAGIATAIVSGGPGALFWIWAYGFIAMAMKFVEAVLGVQFRIARGEQTLAGPMYYLRDGMRSPALAWIFALVAGFAALFTTPFTQPNSVADAVSSQLAANSFDLGRWSVGSDSLGRVAFGGNQMMVGLVLAALTWLVVIGGVKSIGRVAEKLSPLKVGLYLVGGLVVIVTHISELPAVLRLVFSEAFSLRPVAGAATGTVMAQAISFGLRRGSYATEAGFGNAAVAYGTAKSNRPDQQGLNAVMEVFIITYVTCTISALTILLTGAWKSGETGAAAVASAFNSAMPVAGGWMLAVAVFLFGYTTLIGWGYYGEQYLEYLFGRRIITPYRWVYCSLIPFGAIAKVDLVWAWGDILNGLQIFPNLIGLLALSGVAAKYARRK